ncbi:basic-leucine zipper transcription factor [Phycomyces blakesleeanus]
MDFEDIVDMDWLNSHTLPGKLIGETLVDSSYLEPFRIETRETMPTPDQIKQLIELAKQQLALRDQSHSTISPSSVFGPCTTRETPRMRRALSVSSIEDSSLEAMAEADGMDIKKLTARERRQLRNKISARNFRVRRKEYLASLEQQIDHHKQRAEDLTGRLEEAEDENERLRHELELLKQRTPESTKLDHCIVVSNTPSWEDNFTPSLTRELAHYLVNCFVQPGMESVYRIQPDKEFWP